MHIEAEETRSDAPSHPMRAAKELVCDTGMSIWGVEAKAVIVKECVRGVVTYGGEYLGLYTLNDLLVSPVAYVLEIANSYPSGVSELERTVLQLVSA